MVKLYAVLGQDWCRITTEKLLFRTSLQVSHVQHWEKLFHLGSTGQAQGKRTYEFGGVLLENE